MPVKKRLGKQKAMITYEARAAFQIGLETKAVHRAHIQTNCGSDEHCDDCRRHIEASLALHRALHLRPWMTSPLDVDGPEQPAWAGATTAWAETWPDAWKLRQALAEIKT